MLTSALRRRRRLRWFGFVVVCFLCLFAIVTIGLRIHLIQQQYRTRIWLESVGGFVKYGDGGKLATPGFLLNWTDNEPVFDLITAVGITSGSPPMDREGLRMLAKLGSLRSASFHIYDFDNNDLAVLAECKSLEEISLATSSVTDAGLIHLEGMTKLKKLNFFWCDVSEKRLNALVDSLPELEEAGGSLPDDFEDGSDSKIESGSKEVSPITDFPNEPAELPRPP